jgi:hypothetical protein
MVITLLQQLVVMEDLVAVAAVVQLLTHQAMVLAEQE